MAQNQAVLAEGKTKIILASEKPDAVYIRSKDSITAGDGAKRNELSNKSIYSTQTTSNVFAFLNSRGIQTHYLKMTDESTFLAKACDMIPLETVARRIAFGSYLKRHPETPEKFQFDPPLVEFFLKDDARHDPLMSPDEIVREKISSRNGVLLAEAHLKIMTQRCRNVFILLEKAWAAQDVTLVDLKVEFGFDSAGHLILADVIDNDSWRIWPKGDKQLMKDKQVYRNLEKVTPEALSVIASNYADVASATSKFLSVQ